MNRLIKHLTENGISQAHVIRQLGISNRTWYNYKNKRTPMPKTTKLALCYVLNISYDQVFCTEEACA